MPRINNIDAPRTTYLKDVKAAGTAGGTFTTGAFQTRALNTQEGDTTFCSLSSNQFILQPGKYYIAASAPARVTRHQLKLRNITDSTDDIIGTSQNEDQSTSQDQVGRSVVEGVITLTSAKTFEIQHRSSTTQSTNGFGIAANFGINEVYTIVKIVKVL